MKDGSKNKAEEKTEEAGDDEAPMPPAQIVANAKGDEDTDDSGGGRARTEGSPSNFPDLAAVNELNPPIPFNPAAVVGEDEIKAAATPPATQTEHPATQQIDPPTIRQVVAPPSTAGEESIAISPDDEEVGVATSGQRDSFELRSTPNPRVNDQSSPDVEHNSDIRVVAWRVLDETDEERDEEERGEEGPAEPVYEAIPLTWWQKNTRHIIGGTCLLVIGAAVAVGVSLGSNGSGSESAGFVVPSSPSPAKVSTIDVATALSFFLFVLEILLRFNFDFSGLLLKQG